MRLHYGLDYVLKGNNFCKQISCLNPFCKVNSEFAHFQIKGRENFRNKLLDIR